MRPETSVHEESQLTQDVLGDQMPAQPASNKSLVSCQLPGVAHTVPAHSGQCGDRPNGEEAAVQQDLSALRVGEQSGDGSATGTDATVSCHDSSVSASGPMSAPAAVSPVRRFRYGTSTFANSAPIPFSKQSTQRRQVSSVSFRPLKRMSSTSSQSDGQPQQPHSGDWQQKSPDTCQHGSADKVAEVNQTSPLNESAEPVRSPVDQGSGFVTEEGTESSPLDKVNDTCVASEVSSNSTTTDEHKETFGVAQSAASSQENTGSVSAVVLQGSEAQHDGQVATVVESSVTSIDLQTNAEVGSVQESPHVEGLIVSGDNSADANSNTGEECGEVVPGNSLEVELMEQDSVTGVSEDKSEVTVHVPMTEDVETTGPLVENNLTPCQEEGDLSYVTSELHESNGDCLLNSVTDADNQQSAVTSNDAPVCVNGSAKVEEPGADLGSSGDSLEKRQETEAEFDPHEYNSVKAQEPEPPMDEHDNNAMEDQESGLNVNSHENGSVKSQKSETDKELTTNGLNGLSPGADAESLGVAVDDSVVRMDNVNTTVVSAEEALKQNNSDEEHFSVTTSSNGDLTPVATETRSDHQHDSLNQKIDKQEEEEELSDFCRLGDQSTSNKVVKQADTVTDGHVDCVDNSNTCLNGSGDVDCTKISGLTASKPIPIEGSLDDQERANPEACTADDSCSDVEITHL